MPKELPYLPTYKNVSPLFEKIKTAKKPETFTQNFLYDTLGLKGTGDRSLITLLKALGFLDNTGKPTGRYAALKNDKIAGKEIAKGIREAYEALFSANEKAYELNPQDLKGLVAQVAGTDSGTTAKIVGTFKALLSVADFALDEGQKDEKEKNDEKKHQKEGEEGASSRFQGMRSEFHYNIQIHLPSNGSEETYINIFNALRKTFK